MIPVAGKRKVTRNGLTIQQRSRSRHPPWRRRMTMSPVVYREDGSFAMGTLVLIVVVVLAVLLIGYFAWYQPSQAPSNVIIDRESPSVPGPQGPPGPSGTPSPAGPAGPAGPSGAT